MYNNLFQIFHSISIWCWLSVFLCGYSWPIHFILFGCLPCETGNSCWNSTNYRTVWVRYIFFYLIFLFSLYILLNYHIYVFIFIFMVHGTNERTISNWVCSVSDRKVTFFRFSISTAIWYSWMDVASVYIS